MVYRKEERRTLGRQVGETVIRIEGRRNVKKGIGLINSMYNRKTKFFQKKSKAQAGAGMLNALCAVIETIYVIYWALRFWWAGRRE